MGRCAVLIDAGYLYAAGQITCLGARRLARQLIDLDVSGVVGLLRTRAVDECCESYLRTYWYDGAPGGTPTGEHRRIALIDDVKVRLGRLNTNGQQKGVDALICLDLATLAKDRMISHAYLLSGDGDLTEGVRVAQEAGVHVTLIYIKGGRQANNVSPDLLGEADRRIVLTKRDLAAFIRAMPRMEPQDSGPIGRAGREYARQWLRQASGENIQALLATYPQIPDSLDIDLLKAAEAACGTLQTRADLRRVLRSAFWDEIRHHPGNGADG